jgi:hypothetical protein
LLTIAEFIILVTSAISSSVSVMLDTLFSSTQPWPWMCVRSEFGDASDVSSI